MGRNKKLKTRVYHTLFRIDKLIFVIYDDVVKNLKKLRFVYIYEHSNRIILKSYIYEQCSYFMYVFKSYALITH